MLEPLFGREKETYDFMPLNDSILQESDST